MTTAIQESAQLLATAAHFYMGLTEVDANSALDAVIDNAKTDAFNARTRGGSWSRESTTEQIERALFHGSVADDAANNTFRPSTGPVRDYILTILASAHNG